MRILCADDDPDIRVILDLALKVDPGIEATIVESGDAVLARATERWDAFLLDAMMPGTDGYATCERLKADPATAPKYRAISGTGSVEEITQRALSALSS